VISLEALFPIKNTVVRFEIIVAAGCEDTVLCRAVWQIDTDVSEELLTLKIKAAFSCGTLGRIKLHVITTEKALMLKVTGSIFSAEEDAAEACLQYLYQLHGVLSEDRNLRVHCHQNLISFSIVTCMSDCRRGLDW
jgi:hypothetical protein